MTSAPDDLGAEATPEVVSLARTAYVELREGIIRGDHAPGSRLRERDLSESLAMSRIPIREALRRLENEGFVVTFPHRGAVVSQLTLKAVAELFDLRLSLEVLAARQAAAAVAAGQDPSALRDRLDEARRITADGDATRIQLVNTALHEEIIALGGSALLAATMAPLLGRIRWLLALTADRDAGVELAEHVTLVEAITDGNPELAAALAFAHIEHGRSPSLAGLADVLPPE